MADRKLEIFVELKDKNATYFNRYAQQHGLEPGELAKGILIRAGQDFIEAKEEN